MKMSYVRAFPSCDALRMPQGASNKCIGCYACLRLLRNFFRGLYRHLGAAIKFGS